jgi:hypothetical protein
MKMRIQTTSPSLMARHAAQLLGSLVVFRDGIALAFHEDPRGTYNHLTYLLGSRSVERLLVMGEHLLEFTQWPTFRHWRRVSPADHDRVIKRMLFRAPLEGLELVSFEKGSTIVVFKDIIRSIERGLYTILSRANDFLKEGDREELGQTIRTVLGESQVDPAIRYMFAGLIVTSGEKLTETLTVMKAEAVSVESDQ